jgi:hypothetical protein
MSWTVFLVALLGGATLTLVVMRRARRRTPALAEPEPTPLVVPDPVGALRLVRVDPKPLRGAGALIVALEWGRVAPGHVLVLPFAQYADVVVARSVVRVETLPSADDSGLLRVWVGDVGSAATETWAAETLPLNTIVEVFDRAPEQPER